VNKHWNVRGKKWFIILIPFDFRINALV